MVFFKRGEIVTIGEGQKRWSIDLVREEYRRGELVAVADLSDADSNLMPGVLTDKLTKVAG